MIETGTPRSSLESKLSGQTVVVIGGSAGIGLETARLARAQGAGVILTARNPVPLERAAKELDGTEKITFSGSALRPEVGASRQRDPDLSG